MKKVLSLIAILCLALVCFAGCDIFNKPTETPCEHEWADATCTAPKTCSLCGATDGEALGHTEETVAGTAATCTESGMTDGKKCTVCGVTTVEQTVINALGHTEETIAGAPATCTEAGKTDGKKCSVCGVTTVEQTAIDALGHKEGKDDGDVTTAVKCENEGCDHIFVEAKEAITLTIPTFENGSVTADKKNYAIGDTVKLTINPEFECAQKLYINDEPIILGWNTNVYSFVAEEDTYVISGSFEPAMNMAAGDETRWDYINQAHGIVTTYYPNNNDAWWFKVNGNYSSFSINAKNYREVANSYENGPDGGWRIALFMQLDNGEYYAFSMWIDANHKYAYNHFGGKIAGEKDSITTWGGAWHDLAVTNAEATAALNGDGAEFKLERIDGNHIRVSFGGIVLETYEIAGVTAENKVVSVGLHHWGNKGAYVDIPFAVTDACEHDWKDATCTAPKTCSKCNATVGAVIDHTYENYVSDGNATCTEDGTKTGTCVCGDKDTMADAGSALGHTDENVPGKAPTCTETGLTDGKKCSVCGVTTLNQNEIPANGHKDDDNNYKCDVCEANLCTDHNEETIAGKAATCTETGLTDGKQCSICGSITLAQDVIPAIGHKASEEDGNCETAVKCTNAGCDYIFVAAKTHTPEADDGDVTTAVKCSNEGCEQILVPAKEAIALNIPTFENGTVTQDKKNYAAGDTIVLTVSAAKDYAQKLYINGEVLLIDANGKYSFVAEEGKTYDITGEFVYVKGAWFWTAEYVVLNQAHGVFHSPVPAGGEKNGELVPTADQHCGGKILFKDPSHGTKQDFAIVLKMHFSDGQKAEIRIVNKDGKGHYMIQSMSGMFGSWKWYYDLNDEENAAVANGEGVWFGLIRYGTEIEISLNGKVIPHRADTPISLAESTVLNQFKITTFNFSYAIDVHYEFYKNGYTPVQPEPPVVDDEFITIGTFANGTVTADKESYEVGDTVTLTVSPDKDYAQKLYINGEPLLVDTNSKYSFVIEEGKTYDITGEFVCVKGAWYWTAEYIVLNQAHGVFHSPVPAGGEKNGELVPTADKCYGGKVLVKDPSHGTKQDFAIVLKMQFSDGQKAEIRLVNKDGKGHYMVQSMSGMFGSWKWYYDLNDEENAAVANGEGVWFELVRDGSNIDILVNGKVLGKRADTPISLAESTVLNQFKVTTFNFSYAIDVKYEFYIAE